MAQQIGARIRELRVEAGLTQEKLAYESGMRSKGHLSGIERGLVVPTLGTLSLLADRLRVEVFDLLVFPASDPRHAIVGATRGLSRTKARQLLKSLE